MNTLSATVPSVRGLQAAVAPKAPGFSPNPQQTDPVGRARELRGAFNEFVGSTVFGQMLSSMRDTVGKPAYFHGGRAEEVFQGQLDQQLATHLASSEGSSFAEGMFRQQFPQEAELLARADRPAAASPLDALANLRRR